ncbi:MAG: RNA 2',3'-cyclic phosphodiesterase [Bacteroidales bacterium]|nr:RNA 2',3'-cyclic phosphodiesterase [Bacteroidales bacterium]
MNLSLRTFIALEMPTDLRSELISISSRLKEKPGSNMIKWVPVDHIHITLKFLGNTPSKDVPLIQEVIGKSTNFRKQKILVRDFGAFPNRKKPSVLWIGIRPDKNLRQLQQYFEEELNNLGYPLEDRSFKPHLTLGRVKRNISTHQNELISKLLEDNQIKEVGIFNFQNVVFFESQLSKSGAIYKPLFKVKLIN